MIAFILLFVVLSISSCGLGALYLRLIQPGQLLDFMQGAIKYYSNRSVFMHKSLGMCDLCTRQRFTDFAFIFFMLIHEPVFHFHIVFKVAVYAFLYCLFGGLAYYMDLFITVAQKDEETPVIHSQNIEMK